MKPIIVAGLPGLGKSTLLEWLRSRGWRVLEGDRAHKWDPAVKAAWEAALFLRSDAALESYASEQSMGLVIEWGFRADNIGIVAGLVSRGYEIWFLDGDRDAAFTSWAAAKEGRDRAVFDFQVLGLASIDQQISDLLGPRRLRVLEADGSRLSAAEIAAIIVPAIDAPT